MDPPVKTSANFNNAQNKMKLFRAKREQLLKTEEEHDAPPPYEAPPSRTSSLESMNLIIADKKHRDPSPSTSANTKPPERPPPDILLPGLEIIQIGIANSPEFFHFNIPNLSQRCPNLFARIKDRHTNQRFEFAAESTFQTPQNQHLPYIITALRLFESYIQTGTLKSIIKHISYKSITYVILHLIAHNYGCETLSNLALDEWITRWEAIGEVPGPAEAEEIFRVTRGKVPGMLRKCLLHYLAMDTKGIEVALMGHQGEGDGFVYAVSPDWDRHLLLLLAFRINHPDSQIARGPSVKLRCHYHYHRKTQPCKE